MSLSWLVFARYLSGWSAEEISKELMIPKGKPDFQVITIQIELGIAYGNKSDLAHWFNNYMGCP